MFMPATPAQPVYELFGARGMDTQNLPPLETGLLGRELARRQHGEGHTDGPNWPFFLEFASRYVK
jgi:hypothetical protein